MLLDAAYAAGSFFIAPAKIPASTRMIYAVSIASSSRHGYRAAELTILLAPGKRWSSAKWKPPNYNGMRPNADMSELTALSQALLLIGALAVMLMLGYSGAKAAIRSPARSSRIVCSRALAAFARLRPLPAHSSIWGRLFCASYH